jgi:hypothetical protein
MNCELVLKFLATTCLQTNQALASSISAYNHSAEVIGANRSQYHYLLNGQVSQVDRRSSESGIRPEKFAKRGQEHAPLLDGLGVGGRGSRRLGAHELGDEVAEHTDKHHDHRERDEDPVLDCQFAMYSTSSSAIRVGLQEVSVRAGRTLLPGGVAAAANRTGAAPAAQRRRP